MSRKKNEWKDREGVVYSTHSDFSYNYNEPTEETTIPVQNQSLRVTLDKSGRAGKQVTLITGFVGKTQDIEDLTRFLKSKCGTGGSCKDREILIQGDVRDKVIQLLTKAGYKTKRVG